MTYRPLSSPLFPGTVAYLHSTLEEKILDPRQKGQRFFIQVTKKPQGYFFTPAPDNRWQPRQKSARTLIPLGDFTLSLPRELMKYAMKTLQSPPQKGEEMLIVLRVVENSQIEIYPVLGWKGETL